ncbi:Stk1 family PASTA domain-containing Ser/Thr kinase [Rhodococcus sp. D2-41]|uniref:Stk1 family PASTA domain-containing Ser/Thr kinase n=1 Tax=Speluncibacter jeojiensis TaxID=2710754 RepID=UPI00241065D9|nr:Stk1 family PASTA domain-containing Ser/Thr kinase [Rhodococcus sp. D2-41]MDG3011975.1 Stk1 family PASTA domain-containing Ser/Thr kinase [Rhodococcus sp. D2-41]
MSPGGLGLVGELLERRYRVDAPIARGGMSTVYRGLDCRLDRPVAIKVMDPKFAADPQFLSRFEFEARAVARLKDPGLVAVYDQGLDGEHAFLVMELVEGGTLRELLRERGPMPPHAAVAVEGPVLAALGVAHRAGLVHRDIKPENVLISESGEVKVADFGLVRAVAAAGVTSSSVILGTAAYLSPEQVTTGSADTRSDVYASGILMFEMLTGHTPFSGDHTLSVAYRRINEDVPPPSTLIAGVPPVLDRFVLKATARDPRARFADAAEMATALEAARTELQLPRFRVPAPARSAGRLSAARTTHLPHPDAAPTTVAPTTVAPTTVAPTTVESRRDGPQPTRVEARPPTVAIAPANATRQYTTLEAAGSGTRPEPAEPAGRGAPHDRTRSRRTLLVWLVVLAVVAALLGFGGWWLGSGRFTTVPALAAGDKTAVEQSISAADLTPVVHGTYSDTAAVGTVLGLSPGPGTRVTRSSDVAVSVSLGRPTIPDVADKTADQVDGELRERTLIPIAAVAEYSTEVPSGGVVRLSPGPGTVVAVGSTVSVTASKGAPPVPLPDLAGRDQDAARATLAGLGLTVGTTRTQFSPTVAAGRIIGTDPGAGAEISSNTPVTLLISNAIAVPDVEGMDPAQAEAALTKAGLRAVAAGTTSDTDAMSGTVGKTSPAIGKLVDPAHPVVRIYVSDTVKVPSVLGDSVRAAREHLSGLGFDVQVNQLIDTGRSLVILQSPLGGTRARPGSTVTLTSLP